MRFAFFSFFLSFFFFLLPSFLHSTDSNAKTFPCSLNLCCVLPLNKISVTKNLLKYSTAFLFFSSLFSSRSPQVLKSVKLCFPWLISLFSQITLGWALWVFYCLVVEWHHQLNGHEFKQALGDGEGQGILACYRPWGHKESTWLSGWRTMIIL